MKPLVFLVVVNEQMMQGAMIILCPYMYLCMQDFEGLYVGGAGVMALGLCSAFSLLFLQNPTAHHMLQFIFFTMDLHLSVVLTLMSPQITSHNPPKNYTSLT